jgi:uncharacterized protein
MRIVRWIDLKAVPWRNGLGITREIAREANGDCFAWRFSVADVAADGAFSRFDGMRRILTVVDGKGMELQHQTATLQADLGLPVEFDGSLDITSRLKGGPLRDLNLIFDPKQYGGHVSLLPTGGSLTLQCGEKQTLALYCMRGTVELEQSQTLNKGDTAFLESNICRVFVDASSQALLVTIERFS